VILFFSQSLHLLLPSFQTYQVALFQVLIPLFNQSFTMVDNIRVLNIASNDYANMSHNNANALRSIGVYCNDYALSIHPFGYTSQSKAVSKDRIRDIVNTFDVVQIFHTCPILLNVIQEANFKGKIIVYHSGTRYRNESEYWNRVFNPIVHRCITDQTEFMELGAKDIEYLAPHTDLKPTDKRKEGKLIIGHYPSNALVKGTKEIREMLEPFKDDFEIRIDETILPHEENLKRIAECHIYIELFKPLLKSKPYCCFGVTSFEVVKNVSRPMLSVLFFGLFLYVLSIFRIIPHSLIASLSSVCVKSLSIVVPPLNGSLNLNLSVFLIPLGVLLFFCFHNILPFVRILYIKIKSVSMVIFGLLKEGLANSLFGCANNPISQRLCRA
jgi:hypothetical protein